MEKEEINKIISEYMALDKNKLEILLPKFGWFDDRTTKNKAKMQYHNSWDWIIQAWHKVITEIWDGKFEGDVSFRDVAILEQAFSIHVSRNAPLSAAKVVVKTIRMVSSNRKTIIKN